MDLWFMAEKERKIIASQEHAAIFPGISTALTWELKKNNFRDLAQIINYIQKVQ